MPTSLPQSGPAWNPTRLVRVEEVYTTSMNTARVRTDAGVGYLKSMGNNEGPHCLARELIGTRLAGWFGLSVAPHHVFHLPAEACYELRPGCLTLPGPAFVSQRVPGGQWSGAADELRSLVNPDDVTRLVVFDTWIRNNDRHSPDPDGPRNLGNVYLADTYDPARRRLLAIDHTHCFQRGQTLTRAASDIGNVKDDRTYGLFPEFADLISPRVLQWCAAGLRSLNEADVRGIVEGVPPEWEVPSHALDAITLLLTRRAAYLADRIDTGWAPRPEVPTPVAP